MEPIALKARDGLALHGYLTRPPGKDCRQATCRWSCCVHGGPYGVHDVWEFDPEVQLLAIRGYAVLQVNFRGSGGYGDAFERAGYREWGGKMQDDVTDATRWAIDQGIADAQAHLHFRQPAMAATRRSRVREGAGSVSMRDRQCRHLRPAPDVHPRR